MTQYLTDDSTYVVLVDRAELIAALEAYVAERERQSENAKLLRDERERKRKERGQTKVIG